MWVGKISTFGYVHRSYIFFHSQGVFVKFFHRGRNRRRFRCRPARPRRKRRSWRRQGERRSGGSSRRRRRRLAAPPTRRASARTSHVHIRVSRLRSSRVCGEPFGGSTSLVAARRVKRTSIARRVGPGDIRELAGGRAESLSASADAERTRSSPRNSPFSHLSHALTRAFEANRSRWTMSWLSLSFWGAR